LLANDHSFDPLSTDADTGPHLANLRIAAIASGQVAATLGTVAKAIRRIVVAHIIVGAVDLSSVWRLWHLFKQAIDNRLRQLVILRAQRARWTIVLDSAGGETNESHEQNEAR
jgi:hypothetical protein